MVTCCYRGVVYTRIPTIFVVLVLDGSDLRYNWTVAGPSHAVVQATGSRVVIVFNQNASYVVSVSVWNNVSRAAVHLSLVSRGVACVPPSVQLVGGSVRRSELRSRQIRLEAVTSTDCLEYRLRHIWSSTTPI